MWEILDYQQKKIQANENSNTGIILINPKFIMTLTVSWRRFKQFESRKSRRDRTDLTAPNRGGIGVDLASRAPRSSPLQHQSLGLRGLDEHTNWGRIRRRRGDRFCTRTCKARRETTHSSRHRQKQRTQNKKNKNAAANLWNPSPDRTVEAERGAEIWGEGDGENSAAVGGVGLL